MKMVIIGSGIAGTMAYNYFRALDPEVYEARENRQAFSDNEAIIRMKNPAVGFLFGADMKEVEIEKWIFDNGKYYSQPTPEFVCSYSQKVAKSITSRSIENLGKVKRYLVNTKLNIPENKIKYKHKLFDVDDIVSDDVNYHSLSIHDGIKSYLDIKYDVCINTIPLPVITNMFGSKTEKHKNGTFKSLDIYTRKILFTPDLYVDKYYTVYIPDQDSSIYRVNLSPEGIIFESTEEIGIGQCEDLAYSLFRIYPMHYDTKQSVCKKISEKKILNIDSGIRKRLLYQLTSNHSIYSLGRYAIWKNIGTDDLMQDLIKIGQMI